MFAYIPFSILILGFFYLTYKNSPKHAWILLAIVAVSVGIGFIKPLEKYMLIDVVLAIVGIFIVIIQSRKVREKSIQNWFAANGFRSADVPFVKALFNDTVIGTNNYYAYKNELIYGGKKIPFVLGVRSHSQISGKIPTINFHCAYYFKEGIDADTLQQKLMVAKEATPHTGLLKSQLRYFDLKDCDIVKQSIGGVVIRWKVPHSVEGYSERFEWIKKTFAN